MFPLFGCKYPLRVSGLSCFELTQAIVPVSWRSRVGMGDCLHVPLLLLSDDVLFELMLALVLV